jgi:hypothetical protein
MDIQVKIKNVGESIGSVGWLRKNIKSVTLSKSSSGKPGAWVDIEGIENPVCLAILDPYGIAREFPQHDGIGILDRYPNVAGAICFPVLCTDACWASIQSLAEQCRDLIESEIGKEKPIEFVVTEKK